MDKETILANAITPETQSRIEGSASNEKSSTSRLPASAPEIAMLQHELLEWKERCLRLAADFDNFKKRTSRENERRAAELRNALVRDLLPVVDNLERALTSHFAPLTGGLDEGVKLTLRQIMQVLHQHGFTKRDDVGQPFDPHFHEAVGVRSDPQQVDQIILEVWQRGWLQGKALFRPAKVVVNDRKGDNPPAREQDLSNAIGTTHG
jgi:molecular chaperone GrpE